MPGKPSGNVENNRCRRTSRTEDTKPVHDWKPSKKGFGRPSFEGAIT